jgi:RNA polymerase sigma factor (sigma-70 family)
MSQASSGSEGSMSRLLGLSDEELTAACAARPPNEAAWDVFYDRFYHFVRGTVGRVFGNAYGEIEDIIQECFVQIFRVLPKYDRSRGLAKTFIARVVSNQAVDYLRHGRDARARTVPLEADLRVLQIQASRDPEFLRRITERMVARLADPNRISILTDLLEGKDVGDICRSRQVSQYQVYTLRQWLHERVLEAGQDWSA